MTQDGESLSPNGNCVYYTPWLGNVNGPKQARFRHTVDEWGWNTLNVHENAVVCLSEAAHCLPHEVFGTP